MKRLRFRVRFKNNRFYVYQKMQWKSFIWWHELDHFNTVEELLDEFPYVNLQKQVNKLLRHNKLPQTAAQSAVA